MTLGLSLSFNVIANREAAPGTGLGRPEDRLWQSRAKNQSLSVQIWIASLRSQ